MSVAEEVDVDAVVARASQGLELGRERIPCDPHPPPAWTCLHVSSQHLRSGIANVSSADSDGTWTSCFDPLAQFSGRHRSVFTQPRPIRRAPLRQMFSFCSWKFPLDSFTSWSHEQPPGNRRSGMPLRSWHSRNVFYVKWNGVHERCTTCPAAAQRQVFTSRLTDRHNNCCCVSQVFISFPSPFLYELQNFNIQILLELSTYFFFGKKVG